MIRHENNFGLRKYLTKFLKPTTISTEVAAKTKLTRSLVLKSAVDKTDMVYNLFLLASTQFHQAKQSLSSTAAKHLANQQVTLAEEQLKLANEQDVATLHDLATEQLELTQNRHSTGNELLLGVAEKQLQLAREQLNFETTRPLAKIVIEQGDPQDEYLERARKFIDVIWSYRDRENLQNN